MKEKNNTVSARILSIQVGMPARRGNSDAEDAMEREWYSGFIKEPVTGPVRLGLLNLEGDGQADLTHHGGVDKSVLAYPSSHYPLWERELELPGIPFGGFGENFTVEGLEEDNVCIGDTFSIGDAVVQVSQPRQPCWKISRRWKIPDLTARVMKTGRTGWYFRVLKEGTVEAGQPLRLIERSFPEWTVARAMRVMVERKHRLPEAAELAECAALSPGWRAKLAAARS